MRILCVVGTRPQFIKHKILSNELGKRGYDVVLVHTGQHYDNMMNDVFFKDLDIPIPDVNLGVGSGRDGFQIGHGLALLDMFIQSIDVDMLLVYGDCNSTVVGGLASVKNHIPLVHVEAGLRCGDRSFDEETNRILVDHISDVLLCPTRIGCLNLVNEGLNGIFVGDLRYDALVRYKSNSNEKKLCDKYGVDVDGFYLATVHRRENVLNRRKMQNILEHFNGLDLPVLFPCHPFTFKHLDGWCLDYGNLLLVDPVGYLDMLCLLGMSKNVFTDSGGVLVESYLLGKHPVVFRDRHEYPEINSCSCGLDVFGDGKSCVRIVNVLEERYG